MNNLETALNKRYFLAGALASISLLAAGGAAAADDYPQPGKVIRFVVPYPPGGPTDLMARMLQPELQKRLGTTVVVDNRAGAGGNLGPISSPRPHPTATRCCWPPAVRWR